ncbi:MAG: DUF531 family protein, partial [Thermoplasmatota archaeon]
LSREQRSFLITECLKESRKADPIWRRGELLSYLLKDGSHLDKEHAETIEQSVVGQFREFKKGEGLSEAIVKVANSATCSIFRELMVIALENKPDLAYKDVKVLIKNWARKCGDRSDQVEDLFLMGSNIEDEKDRAEMLGYLHLQLYNSDPLNDHSHIFASALSSAMELEGQERLKLISYLSSVAYTNYALDMLVASIDLFDNTIERIKVTTYVSSGADRAGNREVANDLMDGVLKETRSMKDPRTRFGLEIGIARDLARLDRKDQAGEILQNIIKKTGPDDPVRTLAQNMLKEREAPLKKQAAPKQVEKGPVKKRHILALYDTYEGSLKRTHMQAIARAAPLCYGFDLDLALIGFPQMDIGELLRDIGKETNIGEGGEYLSRLFEEKRLHIITVPRSSPLETWNELGLPIATTSSPRQDKAIVMSKAVELSRSEHPGKTVCLIMGLGRHGLPKSLLDSVPYHLELTGSNIPLETATAMGVMVQQLKDATR